MKPLHGASDVYKAQIPGVQGALCFSLGLGGGDGLHAFVLSDLDNFDESIFN